MINYSHNDIILIRGAPTAGKTQLSKNLIKYYDKGVRIEIDTLRAMVIKPKWTNQIEHKRILNLSIKLVEGFLIMQFSPIIIVDTFSGNKQNGYIKLLKENIPAVQIYRIGLFADKETIIKRVAERNVDEFKDVECCIKLNNEIINSKDDNELKLNTSKYSICKSSKIIYDYIEESKKKIYRRK